MNRPTRIPPTRPRWILYLSLLAWLGGSAPALAGPDYERELTALSTALASDATKRKLARLAVADLTDLDGAATPLGRFLAEELSSALTERGSVAVVDRIRLGAALKTEGMPDVGRLNDAELKKLGKRLGVDALVTGTLTDLAEGVRITAKLLSVGTGSVVASAKATLPKTGPLVQLGRPAQSPPQPSTPPLSSTSSAVAAPAPPPRDTRPPAGMTLVPAGPFVFGQEGAERRVFLPAYWIDLFEVTNAEYATVRGIEFIPARANHPITDISWKDATVYCEAQGKRLPTEEEWEKAARGTDGRRFPWGPDYDSARANGDNRLREATGVGRFPSGASPYGLQDMAGNVAEWTSSGDEQARIYKGGAWGSPPADLASAVTNRLTTPFHLLHLGFRCAKDGP